MIGVIKLVREYCKNDIDSLIRLFKLHCELTEVEESKKRKELEDGASVLVYEENGEVKGLCSCLFWKNPEWGNCAEIIMSIDEESEFNEIADSLWDSIQASLKEKEVSLIITHYNEKHARWREFYNEKQFGQWFGIHGMIYRRGRNEKTKLTIRNYEEDDFLMYHTYLGKCFYPMRRANDIRPHNVFEGASPERIEIFKKEAIEQKDSIYMFYDGEKFVGSSIVKEQDIDDIFVVPEYQGRGYGKEIVKATINLALDRNCTKITLGVVAWNKAAIKLYKSLGFEIYQSFEHRRLINEGIFRRI